MGSSFFVSLLPPPPIRENKITFDNIICIKIENHHVSGELNSQCFFQLIHLVLLPNRLTAMRRVGVK